MGNPPSSYALQAVPHVMVVGGRCLYILDPKSFTVKSRVSLSDLDHVSVSAHSDGNCIFHITQASKGPRPTNLQTKDTVVCIFIHGLIETEAMLLIALVSNKVGGVRQMLSRL